MKDPYCVIRIISSRMALDELEVARARRSFMDSSGTKDKKQFTYWKPLGFISDTNIKWTTTIIGDIRQFT